ncbi:MAG TPA: PAS domain-containing protein [Polyangiaceae bacterium]|nr:PAS domain-containing protein [Polyangiaceae bacterium]
MADNVGDFMIGRVERRVRSEEELESLRREVQALRQRVSELQRRTARHSDNEPTRERGGVTLGASAREDLLLEAERIAHVGSWAWDVETNRVFWSDEFYRLLGYDQETVHASVELFFERVHPDDLQRVRAESERSLASGVSPQVDFRLAMPDGSVRHVTTNGSMLFDAGGQLRRVVGALRDRTDELRMHEKVRRTLALLEQAQDIAELGSFVYEPSRGRLEWSASLYRILGLDPRSPASVDTYFERLHPADRERVAETHRRAIGGEVTPEYDCRVVRPSGEVRLVRTRSIAVRDASGKLTEFRGTLLDVTEHAALTEQLARLGKMEAVGRLAGGIAHDFNNLLTVIGVNLELWAEDSGRQREIVDARTALRSAKSLTDRLLAFGRKARLTKLVVAPNELVARTAELVRRVVEDRVRIELVLGRAMPPIHVDPMLIEQALINLIINARDAMPAGGTVTLTTRAAPSAAGSWVEIEVADDGPGLSPELREKIFEPFFTTKGELGTGLGLPMVLGTVEQHGGSVEVDTALGHGTRVRLRLPADPAGQPVSLVADARQAPLALSLGGEVLVIEEDPLVAAVIARTLERHGLGVALAHGATQALELWSLHAAISVVICDVSMAEMPGPALVARLRQSQRPLRVLYVTGYSEDRLPERLDERVLAKPFAPAALVRALSELAAG